MLLITSFQLLLNSELPTSTIVDPLQKGFHLNINECQKIDLGSRQKTGEHIPDSQKDVEGLGL